MTQYTSQQYNDIFGKLPQEIKDVVGSLDASNRIWKIGENHKLHIDKIGIMHDIARDVMMGIIATKNFVRELQNELGIPALDASALARDIDEEIFKPIKNTMIKLYGDGAPYKPSSSLVQFYEEDEEHKALDKDTLLKEIENPPEAIVRKEEGRATALETQEEVKELKDMERKAGVNTQRPIEIKKVGMHLEGARATPEGISSTLDKLASLKLSKTFVMPRGSEEVGKVGSVGEVKKIGSEEEQQKRVAPASPLPNLPPSTPSASEPYTPPAPKKYGTDPYREPLT